MKVRYLYCECVAEYGVIEQREGCGYVIDCIPVGD